MPRRKPIFTKRTKQFTITFPISPMSYRHKLFVVLLSLFIVIICEFISIYRVIISPNTNMFQIITSIVVGLVILSSPLMLLLHIQKTNRRE